MPIDVVNAAVKARILAEALPYIQRFHGQTIVVKYGGNAMTDPRSRRVRARRRPAEARRHEPGHRPRRRAADRRPAQEDGHQSEFRQGMRVTDERVMNVVEMVLGELNQEIVGLINQHGGKAVGLTGQDGAFIPREKCC